jgi:hypothetical protein
LNWILDAAALVLLAAMGCWLFDVPNRWFRARDPMDAFNEEIRKASERRDRG